MSNVVVNTLMSFADELVLPPLVPQIDLSQTASPDINLNETPSPAQSPEIASLFELAVDAMVKNEVSAAYQVDDKDLPLPRNLPDLPPVSSSLFPDIPDDLEELPCSYPPEWDNLCLIDKVRLYNIYKNTAHLHSLGLASYFDRRILVQGHCARALQALPNKRSRKKRNLDADELSTNLGVLVDDCIRGCPFVK